MTDFSRLESALHESAPESIAAALRYLRKADAVMAALAPMFAAQQPAAAAVPPERDWTMIQSGNTSIPAWVVHYANAIGAYMKARHAGHWAVGPVQSREQAPPAPAVPADDAIEAAYWDFDARHKGYGPHKITPQSERDAFKWAVRAMLAAANKENNNG